MTYQTTEEDIDLLVAYALDALEPEEVHRATALLERYPSLHALFRELRATTDALPYALPLGSPAPDLRARVLAHAVKSAPRRSLTASRPARLATWLGVASGALALVVMLLGAQLRNQNAELARTRAELATLGDTQAQVTRVLIQPGTVTQLTGDAGNGTLVRAVDGTLLLAVTLPPSRPDRAYQLWVIDGDRPVSAAVFRVEPGTVVLLPITSVATGQIAAITEEPANGSPGPTTPILISGELG